MPKPTVTADSCQYRVGPVVDDPPELQSPDSARNERGFRELSYLAGSTNSDDMGCGHNYGPYAGPTEAGEDWHALWRRKENLMRHTVAQGSSTFAFPDKKGPKF